MNVKIKPGTESFTISTGNKVIGSIEGIDKDTREALVDLIYLMEMGLKEDILGNVIKELNGG